LVGYSVARSSRKGGMLNQVADKKTVTIFGWNATGRCVWLAQEAQLSQGVFISFRTVAELIFRL